jgi:predicted TIM-barrel fold metal-dependent hydrolase
VIDIHGHFGRRLNGDRAVLSDYVQIMDRNNIALSVSLDAVLGDEESHFEFLQPDSDRFIVFAHIDFVGTAKDTDSKHHACNQPDFVHKTVLLLEDAKKKGVVGLKFFKNFGLDLRNPDGSLIRIDDVRFDPIWQKCGELDLPVLIHTADPAAFFEPFDSQNERYEELLRHPDWSFYGPGFPSREELLTARNRVIARHPQTLFIGAHVANSAEDLATVSQWLDSYPNLYVEIASRIGELGRQPYTARKFGLKYQDRILFGTDGPWPESRLAYYWRFLETWDEYFPYSEKRPPPQGLWHIYGLGLPAEVLKKIYFENALIILPAIKEKYRRVTIDSPVDG